MLPLPMALRSCLVSCRDLAGTEHAVEVTAESLYEAVAQALGILRGDIWVEEIGEGLTELKVRVKQPAVEHRVRMKDFRRWLESQGRTPAECTRKRKLLALAKGGGRGAMFLSSVLGSTGAYRQTSHQWIIWPGAFQRDGDNPSTWIASGCDSLGWSVPGWPDSGLKTHFMWHTSVS